MVKHIVMFRLNEGLDPAVKQSAMENFKAGIEKLPATISTIRSIFVGFNVNPAEHWDICLESVFDSLEDVCQYGSHPDHCAVASALKPYIAERSCVDFVAD